MKLYEVVCRDQRTRVLETLDVVEMWPYDEVGHGAAYNSERDQHNHKVIKDLMKEKYPTYHCWEIDCGLYEFWEYETGKSQRYEKTVYTQEIK